MTMMDPVTLSLFGPFLWSVIEDGRRLGGPPEDSRGASAGAGERSACVREYISSFSLRYSTISDGAPYLFILCLNR